VGGHFQVEPPGGASFSGRARAVCAVSCAVGAVGRSPVERIKRARIESEPSRNRLARCHGSELLAAARQATTQDVVVRPDAAPANKT
jgi:hypothetical protein